jgi:hypothetical protein
MGGFVSGHDTGRLAVEPNADGALLQSNQIAAVAAIPAEPALDDIATDPAQGQVVFNADLEGLACPSIRNAAGPREQAAARVVAR